MNKVRKSLYIFVIGLLCYGLLTNIVKADEQEKIVIIDDVSVWKYSDNTWYNINYNYKDYEFLVYINNEYYGLYKIAKTNKYDLYDNKGNMVSYSGNIFAASTNFDIKPIAYTLSDITEEDVDKINETVKETFNKEDFVVSQKIITDLDNNGYDDAIINVSNLDERKDYSIFFNLTYVKFDNNQIQILRNETIEPANVLISPIYNIKYVLDNGTNFDSIILQERYFSTAGKTTNILYEYQNGSYKETTIEEEKETIDNTQQNEEEKDYSMYIFCGILLVVFILGYLIFKIIKYKPKKTDV